MNLYYINLFREGADLDEFVQAGSAEEAWTMYREHQLAEDYLDETEYAGAIDPTYGGINAARIFHLTATGERGVLSWYSAPSSAAGRLEFCGSVQR